MATLPFANFSTFDLGIILGDFNAKSVGLFNFWYLFLWTLFVILLSLSLKIGEKKAILATTLFMSFTAISFAALGLINWVELLSFGFVFLFALLWYSMNG